MGRPGRHGSETRRERLERTVRGGELVRLQRHGAGRAGGVFPDLTTCFEPRTELVGLNGRT